jgi:hypothetical protein
MNIEENKPNSLEKIKIRDTVGYIENTSIELFKEELSKIEERAKDKGFSKLKIGLYAESDDEIYQRGFYISGDRIETDQEYHTRIYWLKQSCQNSIDDIEKAVANKEKKLARLKELKGILSNIPK